MKTFNGVDEITDSISKSVVTIGNYDGLHLGHREIISKLTCIAKEKHIPSVVMTFHPHPRKVLQPERAFQRIFDTLDQVEVLKELGVDYFIVEPFSRALSQLDPKEFFLEKVLKPFSPDDVVIGYDFSFGANRSGSQDLLKEMGEERGYELHVIEQRKLDEKIVSSSEIRKLLCEGNIKLANKMLDRPYYLKGIVEKGDGRGRTIGIPTANLRTADELIPQTGVYVTYVKIDKMLYPAVTNIGRNPTFLKGSPERPKVESHLLGGFDKDIYGKSIEVIFRERIRDEMKFDGPEMLVKQIKSDIITAKEYFGRHDEMG